MAITVRSLASGSSGNSFLVRDGRTSILVDAGVGIRRLTSVLMSEGVNPFSLSAILISHEHSDHIAGAVRMARKYNVPLISNADTLGAIEGAGDVPHKVLDVGSELVIGDFSIRSFCVSHDAIAPVGYSISSFGTTICIATDTGIMTPQIKAEALAADLLIVESNHDSEMLIKGPYPWMLKRRIMSERGHLSNDTTSSLLVELVDSGRPVSIWLAHLSAVNNTPKLALAEAQYAIWSTLGAVADIQVALRDCPSLTWHRETHPFQLSLNFDFQNKCR